MEFEKSYLQRIIDLSFCKKKQLYLFLDNLFKSDYVLIKEIIIDDPPTKYTLRYKKEKFDKNRKLITHQDYYLTGNLFYSDKSSFHTISKIIQESKEFLFPYLQGIPQLDKMRLEFEYHKMQDIDLDNKFSYWCKLFLDILKTPTQRQIDRAIQYKKPIITTNTLKDDNTKCVDKISMDFKKGEHKMIFRIYGRIKSEQKTLDLFFI